MTTMTSFMLIAGEWELMQVNMLKSREGFDEEMFKLIYSNPNNKYVEEITVHLPSYVTTKERYRLHTYTTNGIYPWSETGVDGLRYMSINLSADYLNKIYKRYYTVPEIVPEPPPVVLSELETFKKKLLQDIMELVEKHLRAEFQNFLN